MFGLVSDWFLRPASDGEISASIGRLLARGEIARFGEGEFDFENGGAKLDHGGGGEVLLRAA